jgi:hypothetical protein
LQQYIQEDTMTTEERTTSSTQATGDTWRHTPPNDLDALANYVEVVGLLERSGRLSDAQVVARRYSDVGAAVEQLRVQVIDAGGTVAYGMRLAVPAALRRAIGAQVATLDEGVRIKVWGHLNRPVSYDARFRDQRSVAPDAGREYREVVVEVRGMALAHEDDIDGTLVVLQGRVLRPPFIGSHDTDVNLEVARTSVEVAWSFPARPDRPGVLEHGCTTLLLETPLLLENAAAVFAPGNVVRVEGRLEPFVEHLDPERAVAPVRRRRGSAVGPNVVASAIERLDAEWEARRAKLTEGELAKAERSYYARRRSLQQDRALRVRVGLVTLVSGRMISVGEARRLRTERLERRRQAVARQGELVGVVTDTSLSNLTEEIQAGEPIEVAAAEEHREQPQQPMRHRRKRQAEVPEVPVPEVVADVLVEVAVEPATVMVVETGTEPNGAENDTAEAIVLVEG